MKMRERRLGRIKTIECPQYVYSVCELVLYRYVCKIKYKNYMYEMDE